MDSSNARSYYAETGDVVGALRRFPRQLTAECAILSSFKKAPTNHLQALLSIPRTLRMMYVHSYQSFLFNHAATCRIQKHGSERAVEGDLVVVNEGEATTEIPLDEKAALDTEADVATVGQDDTCPVPGVADVELADVADVAVKKGKCAVRHVSADDVKAGRYSMEDVVLPLVGGETLFPDNESGEIFQELAKKDGIDVRGRSHNVQEFSLAHLPGGYRRVIVRPKDYDWSILPYDDVTKPLAATDLDLLNQATNQVDKTGARNGSADKASGEDASSAPADDDTGGDCHSGEPTLAAGAQKAFQMRLTLPSSCYATMAIRELLKTSTLTSYHKALNEP